MIDQAFACPIRVYVEDTDAGGIVFYANYLKYMERARTEFFRSLGFHKPALFDGLQFVVKEIDVVYHHPAVLDDLIDVRVMPTKLSRVTIEIQQQVYKEDNLLAEGRVKLACVGVEAKRPKSIPVPIHNALNKYIC